MESPPGIREVDISDANSARYRKSRVRNSILEYLRAAPHHPSAEDVHAAVKKNHPKVSFGTVYRNLNILVDQGKAGRIESSRGRDLFDGTVDRHAHFRCDSCGRLYDVPVSTAGFVGEVIERTGHRISGQHIEFSGTCADCLRSG